MKNIVVLLLLLFRLTAFSQNDPQEVTPTVQKKIKPEIDKAVVKLQSELKKGENTPLQIEFSVDTFRVEKYFELYTTYDYTTAGMVTAGYEHPFMGKFCRYPSGARNELARPLSLQKTIPIYSLLL